MGVDEIELIIIKHAIHITNNGGKGYNGILNGRLISGSRIRNLLYVNKYRKKFHKYYAMHL